DRLRPDVIIDEVDLVTGAVGDEVARFERLHASPAIEAYVAAFQTADHFVAGGGYRISVQSDGVELGFADVAAVATRAERATVPPGFVGVVVGANFKVRFRIEQGVLDQDGDGVLDPTDVCPAVADPDQADEDGDGFGDACDCLDPADPDDPSCPAASCDGDPCGESDVCFNRGCIEEDGGVTCTEDAFRHDISLRVAAPAGAGAALYTLECGQNPPASFGPCESAQNVLQYRCVLNNFGEFRVQVEGTAAGCVKGKGPLVPWEPDRCSVFQVGPNTIARCCYGNLFPD
ncbi:MAG TPA: hypothetical protein VKB80_01725, partial [Kofleriaceae bacterium]|nr:hypothetical protein [Kofleriaceae bacterium]